MIGGGRHRLATVLALALGCAPDPSEKDALTRARNWLDRGRPDAAVVELRSALAREAPSAGIHALLGELLRDSGRAGEAAFHLGEAWRLDPDRSDAAMALYELVVVHDQVRAEALIRDLLARHPEHPEALVAQSELALLAGDLPAGLEAAAEAAGRVPASARVQLHLGLVRILAADTMRGQEDAPADALRVAGLRALEAALARAGSEEREVRERALRERARLLGRWPGRRREAVAAWRALLDEAFDGDDPAAAQRAARRCADWARPAREDRLLRDALRRAAEAEGGSWSWLALARLDEAEGRSGEATLRRLLAGRGDPPHGRVLLAQYLRERHRPGDAIAVLEEALAAGSEAPLLLAELARVHEALGDRIGAERALERLEGDFPHHPTTYVALARAALADARWEQAAGLVRAAQALGARGEAERLAVEAALRAGDLEAARKAAVAARMASPEDVQLLRLEIAVHREAGAWGPVLSGLRALQRQLGRLAPEDVLVRAAALEGVGRREAALDLLESLAARPDAPVEAVLAFADRAGPGRSARARALLEGLLARRPAHPGVLALLTRMDLEAGRAAAALARLDRVLPGHPGGHEIRLLRAAVLARLGRIGPAEAELRRVLAERPDHRRARETLASLYTQSGRLREAIASYEELSLAPERRVLLARLYRDAGERDRARETLEGVLRERADLPGAKNDLAYLLAERGEALDRARTLAREALAALPGDAAVIDTLGYVELRRGRADRAAVLFERALARTRAGDPHAPLLHYHRGLALRRLGRREEAIRAFEAALALDGRFPEADAVRRALADARKASVQPGAEDGR